MLEAKLSLHNAMKESIFKKRAYPVVLISLMMAGIFALRWIQEQRAIKTLVLATAGSQGQYYAFGQALAQVVAQHNSHLQIKVIATEGSSQNLDFLRENKAQIALIQSNIPTDPTIKAVSFLFPELFHLIATDQSGIEQVQDLRGKRVALMPKGSGSYALFEVLSRHYGLSEQTIQGMPMSPQQAYQFLAEGRVDALFQVTALGNPAIARLLQTQPVQLIAIDQGAALRLSVPALEDQLIPIGTYDGAIPIPAQNLPGVAVRSLLVSREDVDWETIYELTRILYEARNDLVKHFPQAAMISEPDALQNLGFAFHPGATAFYDKEKPSFIVEYAEPLGLLVSVSVLLVSGLWQFRLWFQGKQKNRADFYNLEILKLIDNITSALTLAELEEIRQQLFKIFERVILDLDRDRLSPESFQSFTFPWQVALTTLRHRETLLLSLQSLSQESPSRQTPITLVRAEEND